MNRRWWRTWIGSRRWTQHFGRGLRKGRSHHSTLISIKCINHFKIFQYSMIHHPCLLIFFVGTSNYTPKNLTHSQHLLGIWRVPLDILRYLRYITPTPGSFTCWGPIFSERKFDRNLGAETSTWKKIERPENGWDVKRDVKRDLNIEIWRWGWLRPLH